MIGFKVASGYVCAFDCAGCFWFSSCFSCVSSKTNSVKEIQIYEKFRKIVLLRISIQKKLQKVSLISVWFSSNNGS